MGRRFLRGEQQDSLARLEKALADLSKRLDDHAEQTTHRFHRVLQVLERMVDDEPANRRLLLAARQAEDYERAYTDPDQLVSVLIPTFENAEGLRERSLPSVLAQTHENLEVLVVGDAAPQAVADVVADVADPRVRWYNRPYRGPYPDDEQLIWLVSGDAPWNDALGLARGQWIAPFADDDAMRPDALASVLAEARRSHLELCYGALEMHHRDGRRTRLGTFPPKLHEFGLQGGIFHAGLRFLQHQPIDALFQQPSDWSLVRRMMRIGVRIGYLDQIVCDYHPGYRAADAEPS